MLEAILSSAVKRKWGPLLTYEDFLDYIENGSGATMAPNGGYDISGSMPTTQGMFVVEIGYGGKVGFLGAMTGSPFQSRINLPNSAMIRVVQHALPTQAIANDYVASKRVSLLRFDEENTREFNSVTRNGFISSSWFPSFFYPGQRLREFIYWDESLSSAMWYDPFDINSVPEQYLP